MTVAVSPGPPTHPYDREGYCELAIVTVITEATVVDEFTSWVAGAAKKAAAERTMSGRTSFMDRV